MAYQWLLVAHIAVLGYWLGAELVINAGFRYVCRSDQMPMDERTRLMSHVMDVDQHVRYALVLQVGLGFALASLLGYVPGGQRGLAVITVGIIVWLIFIEAAHRLRGARFGPALSFIDRSSRLLLIAAFLLLAFVPSIWDAPNWLRWKLALFAGVIACGIGIRQVLIGHFRVWTTMERHGATDVTNRAIRRGYIRATAILLLLWAFILLIVASSILKF